VIERKQRVDAFFRETKAIGGGGSVRPGMRARIYVRVSDTRGREETIISPENQIDHCLQWASREGVVVVGEPVVDLNMSGRTFSKRKIGSMIAEVKADEYDIVIVWKWSRWGRNLTESMINMALLHEVGGVLIAATEPVDVTTPTGVFSRTQFLAMAQLQLDQIREGWRDAHRSRLSKGLPHSGIQPFGYLYLTEERDPEKMYVPDPDTFPLLREMYIGYINGTSHRGIALDLNARGFTGRRGALWTPNTARQVLDSGFGAGRISYGQFEEISDLWEHAITADEWDAYQQRRQDTGNRLPPRTAGQKTIAKGLVHCADCGRRMSLSRYTQKKGDKVYKYAQWRCNGVVDFRCKGSMIRETAITEKIRSWIEMMATGGDDLPEMVARKMRVSKAQADIEALTTQIATTKALKKKGMDMVMRGKITEEEFDDLKADYDRQLASLEGALQASRSDAAVNATPPADVFGALLTAIDLQMDPDGLNTALKAVVARIDVSKSAGPQRRPLERIRIVPTWDKRPTLRAVS
jgi:DNA invertase Pin-like site-specific DNA recombinase